MTKPLRVIRLQHFHCQQWTLQQEHLTACKRISYSDRCGTHLDAQREWGSCLPPIYKTPTSIWILHMHVRRNKRTIVHPLAKLRAQAELHFQHCQTVCQGTWCKWFKTYPRFTGSEGGVLFLRGKQLSLLPPSCISALHTHSTLWFLWHQSCVSTNLWEMNKCWIKFYHSNCLLNRKQKRSGEIKAIIVVLWKNACVTPNRTFL